MNVVINLFVYFMDQFREVFKYTSAKTAKLILDSGTIKFSNPRELNDPLDLSKVNILGFDINDESIKDKLIKNLVELIKQEQNYPHFVDSDLTRLIQMAQKALCSNLKVRMDLEQIFMKSAEKKEIFKTLEQNAYSLKEFSEALHSFDTIFCGTKTWDNTALWSHYADKHSGVVIKFVPNIEKDSILRLLKEVKYTDIAPILFSTPEDFIFKSCFNSPEEILLKFLDDFCHTKDPHWKYENEIRVYADNKPNNILRICRYLDDELDSVYLGLKISKSDEEEIIRLAKTRNKNVTIYKIFHSNNSNKLDAKQIA